MRRILLFVFVLAPALAAASDTLVLSESGYDSERKIVARLYAKEIEEAKSLPNSGGEAEPTIAIAIIDLNRDGKQEIVARLDHSYFCGSHGCKLVILSLQPNGNWQEIASLISHGDVEVRDEYKNNYRTISFDHSNKSWMFHNGKYQ